jgi:Mce-associated membrane protein
MFDETYDDENTSERGVTTLAAVNGHPCRSDEDDQSVSPRVPTSATTTRTRPVSGRTAGATSAEALPGVRRPRYRPVEVVTEPDPTPVEKADGPTTTDEDEAEVEVEVEVESSAPTRPVRTWVGDHGVAALAGLVAAALAVALALTLMQLGNRDALSGARASALAAAKTYSVELAGYNYRHLGHDFAVVEANSTPTFRRTFAQSSDALKATLNRYHATADATVVSAGIVSASTSRVVALVFLDQKITNSTQSAATNDRSQVEITLLNSGGKWYINQVSLL